MFHTLSDCIDSTILCCFCDESNINGMHWNIVYVLVHPVSMMIFMAFITSNNSAGVIYRWLYQENTLTELQHQLLQ